MPILSAALSLYMRSLTCGPRAADFESELGTLHTATSDDAGLAEMLRERTSPPAQNPETEKWERDRRRREYVYEGRKRQRDESWMRWREQLKADPEAAFSPESMLTTAARLHSWLSGVKRRESWLNVWDREALVQGSARRSRRAQSGPSDRFGGPIRQPHGARNPRERGTAPSGFGATGCAAWPPRPHRQDGASQLAPDEARTAAVYATIEINGFPAWLADLVATHPDEVVAVLGNELAGELALGAEHPFLSTLQHLSRSDHQSSVCSSRSSSPSFLAGPGQLRMNLLPRTGCSILQLFCRFWVR